MCKSKFNLRAVIAFVSVLVIICFSLTMQNTYGAEIAGHLDDPADTNLDAWIDIISAWIEQKGSSLTLVMEMRGDIPTVLTRPDDSITFLWFVDADNNTITGQPHGGVGSDFNVRAVVGEFFGGGYVDICGSMSGGGFGEVSVQGNQIRITIGIAQIGQTNEFEWRCGTFQVVDDIFVPGNTETKIAVANLFPYSVPASVILIPPLLMLSPSGPDVGNLQLEIYDAQGNMLPHQEHQIIWHSSNETVATVSVSGEVKVHNVPSVFWETPYINVSVDGMAPDNAVVIRSTNTNIELSHQMFSGEHVAFYLPTIIEGVDLKKITLDYQIVEATDFAYKAQMKGIGTMPYPAAPQYFVLDVTDDPNTVPCGLSGNPIRLGWEYGKPIHNSCYIVNVPENRTPQWFVIFHEIGHNFQGSSRSFNEFVNAANSAHLSTYSEGLATLAFMWSCYSIITCDTESTLYSQAKNTIQADFSHFREVYIQDLRDYQNGGSNYAKINPNILDGILYEMYDFYGPKVWFDLFSTFLPADEPLPCKLNTEAQQATWFVAVMSASVGEDLREYFRNNYGFPIDDKEWLRIYACVEERILERDWQSINLLDIEHSGFSTLY